MQRARGKLFHPHRVFPQFFELIVIAQIGLEEVNHKVEIIGNNPSAFCGPGPAKTADALSEKIFLHFVGQCPEVGRAVAGRDQIEIGDR